MRKAVSFASIPVRFDSDVFLTRLRNFDNSLNA